MAVLERTVIRRSFCKRLLRVLSSAVWASVGRRRINSCPTFSSKVICCRTLLTFLFDSGYVWCVNLLLALVLIHLTSLPILPIYAICQFVDVVKCVIGGVLVKKGIWIRDITGKTPSAPAEKGDMA